MWAVKCRYGTAGKFWPESRIMVGIVNIVNVVNFIRDPDKRDCPRGPHIASSGIYAIDSPSVPPVKFTIPEVSSKRNRTF